MRWVLFLLAGLAFLYGLPTYGAATTIFQQIVDLNRNRDGPRFMRTKW